MTCITNTMGLAMKGYGSRGWLMQWNEATMMITKSMWVSSTLDMEKNDLHNLVIIWPMCLISWYTNAFVVISVPLLSQADLSARCQWSYEAMAEIMCDIASRMLLQDSFHLLI